MIDNNYKKYVENQDTEKLKEMLSRINSDKFKDEYDFVKATIDKHSSGITNDEKVSKNISSELQENHTIEAAKDEADINFWERDSTANEQPNKLKSIYGSIVRRIVAVIIDSIVLGFPFMLIILPLASKMIDGLNNSSFNLEIYQKLIILSILSTVVSEVYNIVGIKIFGRTIGKRLMDIKVVQFKNNELLTLFQSIKRRVIFFLPSLIGYLTINAKYIYSELSHISLNQLDSLNSVKSPFFFESANTVFSLIMFYSIVMIISRSDKRGIQDFIGGSVVIYDRG